MPPSPPVYAAEPTSAWSSEALQASFQLVADGFVDLLGFGLAILNIARGDAMVAVTVAATEHIGSKEGSAVDARDLLDTAWPLADLVADLENAEDWGRFKYLRHEFVDRFSGVMWVPDIEATDDPERWHPYDMLIAPLHDPEGRLLGAVSVDLPQNGRLPGPELRRLMNGYAAQAETIVVNAMERERLEPWARYAQAARQITGAAAGERTLAAVVDAIGPELLDRFALAGVWLRLFEIEGDMPLLARVFGAIAPPDDPLLTLTTHIVTPWLWQQGEAAIIGQHQVLNVDERIQPVRQMQEFLRDHGVETMLHVPIGAGQRCFGALTLFRSVDAPEWNELEYSTAVEIGRDLGVMLASTRALEQEQELVNELTQLDAYKDALVGQVTAELEQPLNAIVAQLDRFDGEEGVPLADPDALDTVMHNARRMNRLVDNLLLLSRLADPHHPLDSRPLDLVPLVTRVCEHYGEQATADTRVVFTTSDPTVAVHGDADELGHLVANLVHNAVKFTPAGGTVSVELRRSGRHAELSVTDQGEGIPEGDLDRLFEEFYRSSSPSEQDVPGTGLGLAIAARVARRHAGHIDVESRRGVGSVFRFDVPLAGQPDDFDAVEAPLVFR